MEIKFENVSFVIDKDTPLEKTVLDNVNFEIKESGIYSFLGNSNSGKTCIGELCNALITPTKGRVIVDNYINDGRILKNVNNLRRNIGYVFKNPTEMFFNSSVKKEIMFGMKYFKYKLDVINERVTSALKLVGLDESYLNKDPFNLSLAESKKVALTSVIAFNPSVIILDEPTIGLNEKEKKDLIKLLKLMRDKYNRTIIILSKDSDFVYECTDYTYLMDKSKIIKSGKKELFTEIILFETLGLKVPDIVKFVDIYNEKANKNLSYYRDIKDLIKGVCRDVF